MTSPGPSQNPNADPGNTAANPYENLDLAAIDARIAELTRRKNSHGDPTKGNTAPANPYDYGNLDVATIDARIAELTQRLSQRRAGGSGHGRGEPLPAPRQTGMANIAGAAADSFAQAFVDRFASIQGQGRGMDGNMGSINDNPTNFPLSFASTKNSDKGGQDNAMKKNDEMGGYEQMLNMNTGGAPGLNFNMDMDFMRQGGSVRAQLDGQMQMAGQNSRGVGDMQSMGMNFPSTNRMNTGMTSFPDPNTMDFPTWQQQINLHMQRTGSGMMDAMNMMLQGGFNPSMLQQQEKEDEKKIQPANVLSNSAPALPMKPDKLKKRASNQTIASKITPELLEASKGPFKTVNSGIPLGCEEDKDWLTPLHCFIRKYCVEAFTATKEDIKVPSKGKRKAIQVGQVGIRCPHCWVNSTGEEGFDLNHDRGSVYYPSSISAFYNSTMNLIQRHIHSCPQIPKDTLAKFNIMKQDDARSGSSKKYWVESARAIGFVDTVKGVRLSANAPLPSRTEKSDRKEEVSIGEGKTLDETTANKEAIEAVPLVLPSDKEVATSFSYLLMSQMVPCVFTEADRLGKRNHLPGGFAGLACRHCFGGYGNGRFFPSSLKTLSDTSKTLLVQYNHITRCRKCPQDVLDALKKAKDLHDTERSTMKFGSQKAFFAKIWARLHENRPYDLVAVSNVRKRPAKDDGNLLSPKQLKSMQYTQENKGNQMTTIGSRGIQMLQGLGGGQMPQLSMDDGQQGGLMKKSETPLGAHMPLISDGPPNMNMMNMMAREMMMKYQWASNNIEQSGGGTDGNGIGNVSGVPQAAKMPVKMDAEDNEMTQSERVMQI